MPDAFRDFAPHSLQPSGDGDGGGGWAQQRDEVAVEVTGNERVCSKRGSRKKRKLPARPPA